VFNGVTLYTRRGDFQENGQGFPVNSAGYCLWGVAIDRTTGNTVGGPGACGLAAIAFTGC